MTADHDAKAGEIVHNYRGGPVGLIPLISAALREAEERERERCKRVNADIIAMVLSENPDASPAYLAVQICERIENA